MSVTCVVVEFSSSDDRYDKITVSREGDTVSVLTLGNYEGAQALRNLELSKSDAVELARQILRVVD